MLYRQFYALRVPGETETVTVQVLLGGLHAKVAAARQNGNLKKAGAGVELNLYVLQVEV